LKLLLDKFFKNVSRLSDYLIAFGPFGLFAVAVLDSSFVPLPSSADALMLLLTAAHPRWMVFYAIVATAGSTLGCWLLYSASRRAGRRALSRFSESKQMRVKGLIDRYDVLSVLVASVLPPPFPFKLFVITAGVFRFSLTRFLAAIVVGRGFRFLLEGYFAIRYGAQAKGFLAKYYPWIGLGLAVIIIAGFMGRSLWKRKSDASVAASLEAGN
jgi:membrane protein YqaA with SNARE-associated domain